VKVPSEPHPSAFGSPGAGGLVSPASPATSVAHEPLLWILSDDFSTGFSVQSGHFSRERPRAAIEGRQPGKSFYVSWHDFIKAPLDYSELERIRLIRDEENHIDIYGIRRLARVTFGDQYTSEPEAREGYGDRFASSVPDHQVYEHPREYGCIHRDFVSLVEESASWLEIAALTAATYAHQAVVIVAPAGTQLPPSVISHPVCRGKEFVFIRLEEFSRDERDKLRVNYRLQGESGKADFNWEMFEKLMPRLW
jgi:hypothetical protein